MIERKDGVTVAKGHNWSIATSSINRYRYNDLRKRDSVTFRDVIKAIINSLK